MEIKICIFWKNENIIANKGWQKFMSRISKYYKILLKEMENRILKKNEKRMSLLVLSVLHASYSKKKYFINASDIYELLW